MSMFLLLAFVISAALATTVDIQVTRSWTGGMDAKFDLPISTNIDGWTLTFRFNKPVHDMQIWNAQWQNQIGSSTIIVKNLQWNKSLLPSNKLSMNFLIQFDGSVPSGNVTLDDGKTLIPDNGDKTTTKAPIVTQVTKPETPVKASGKYNYGTVLKKSILFYEAQRSGHLPASNRVPWRADSALNDRGQHGEDLTGGWYDAGDNVKFGFPMAASTTLLAWGLIQWESAYQTAGQLTHMRDSIKWPLDYFIKAHTSADELYVQVGDGNYDHSQWIRPEDMSDHRPSYKVDTSKPGSDVAGETAAAMTAGYLVFKDSDLAYATTLLNHARQLYSFANLHHGIYSSSVPEAAAFYRSNGYQDELAWAAAWLYKATGDITYLNDAKSHIVSCGHTEWAVSWADKCTLAKMLLYQETKDASYRSDVKSYLDKWRSGTGDAHPTPKGLEWILEWAPNRYAANTAFVALMAADSAIDTVVNRNWAQSQIDYMLGDAGRSFVVGFGHNPPQRPHHRASSCPNLGIPCGWDYYNTNNPNPHVIDGALVGGPDQHDGYTDDRKDHKQNEVATDYNAGFQSAVAGLLSAGI